MIPTMILLGLVLGRWWRTALVVAAISWPILLLSGGIISVAQVPVSAGLAIINAGVGVLVGQGGLRAYRTLRHRGSHQPTSGGETI